MNAWTRHLRPALAGLAVYEPADSDAAVPPRARLHANECAEPWPPEVLGGLQLGVDRRFTASGGEQRP